MERDELIRQWASEGLDERQIVERLRELDAGTAGGEKPAGPVRSFIRGLPGYGAVKGMALRTADAVLNPIDTAKGAYEQLGAGIHNVVMAAPEGAFRLAGMDEQADVLGTERHRVAEDAGAPEGIIDTGARFAGTMAPYVATGMAAGPNLIRGLAAGAALDVPVAASEREMSLAGMVADYADPESTTGRVAGYVAESPALRGITEAAGGVALGGGLAKGIPAGVRHLRGMGEAGATLGRAADDVPPQATQPEADIGPLPDAVEAAVGQLDDADGAEAAAARAPLRNLADDELRPGPDIETHYSPGEIRDNQIEYESRAAETKITAENLIDFATNKGTTVEQARERLARAGYANVPDEEFERALFLERRDAASRPDAGAAHPAVLGPLVGAATGGTVGAATAEEDQPLAARVIGGVALGAGLGVGLAGFRSAAGDVTITGLREADEVAQVTPSQAALAKAEEVHLPAFNLDPSGTQRLQRHIARIVDASRPEDLRQRTVTWEETKAVAQGLGLNPSDIDKVAAQRMTGAETLAVRDLIAQNVDDLTKLENKLKVGLSETGMPLTAGQLEETRRLINSLESQNDQYLRRFLRARSEAGRNLNNLKILANRSLDPAAWLAKAEKVKGSPLSEFEGRELRKLLAGGDRLKLAEYVGSLYEAPMADKLVTLWKAGLLSNPTTHMANMVGNFTMATLETLKDAPAALFDRLAAQVSDVRSKGGISMDAVRAGWEAADFRGAARQVITGNLTDASMLAKYDVQRQVDFDNWPASAFLNAYAGPRSRIFASLQAGDKIFKSFALGRSLTEQATVMAKNEGLSGAELAARVDELINSDSALHARAIVDAEVATFLNKGSHTTFRGVDLAEAGEGLRRHLGPAGHVIAPFVRTPANIMDRVLEYSPVGYLADLPKMADWLQKIRQGARSERGLTPQDLAEIMELQREMVEQAGRATIGTGAILAGYVLAERGLLTGNYPTDTAERNVHELLNEQPHSIKVDGHWLSLDRISPVGNLLTLGAEVYDMGADPELGLKGAAAAAPGVMGKTIVEQSFLSGVQGALDALAAPERSMAQWARNTAASTVPSAVYAAARALDPVVRDPQTVGEAMRARLPGLSTTVTPRISGFGEERVRDTSLAGRVGQLTSPFTMRESQEADPTKAEVGRVTASIGPYRPRGVERGTPEYEALQREYGEASRQAAERAIASGEYGRQEREAARLIDRNPDYAGRSVEDVTKELMAEYIENEVRRARSALTERRTR